MNETIRLAPLNMRTKRSDFDAERNTELFNRYAVPYLPFIRSRCYFFGGPGDWEDLYQEAQMAIFRYIHTYNPEYSLFCWLKRGVTYAFSAYCRKYRKFPLTHDLWGYPEPQEGERTEITLSPENYRDHFSDPVASVLEKLSEPMLRVFLLYLNGYSANEILARVPKKKSTGGCVSFEGLRSNIFLTKKYLKRSVLAALAV